jgi:hypothetical protein
LRADGCAGRYCLCGITIVDREFAMTGAMRPWSSAGCHGPNAPQLDRRIPDSRGGEACNRDHGSDEKLSFSGRSSRAGRIISERRIR